MILNQRIYKAVEYWLHNYNRINVMIEDLEEPSRVDLNQGIRGKNHISKPTEQTVVKNLGNARLQELKSWQKLIDELQLWTRENDLDDVYMYLYTYKHKRRCAWDDLNMSRRTFYYKRREIVLKAFLKAVDAGLMSEKMCD